MINMHTISKLFVDTNIFVAINDETDSTHNRALDLKEKIRGMTDKLYTSSDIIGETLTVLSKKLGKEKVNEFYNNFSKLGIKEIFINESLHNETRKFFAKVKSKNISFIDCSSVIAMKRNKIKYIFSFDEDFRSMGVKLLSDAV